MTSDKDYLGKGNIDKFDALFFKIRHFGKNDQGQNFYLELLELIRIICFFIKAKKAVPKKRSPHQRYILSTHESAGFWQFVNRKYMSK